jgi:hypothetical protein
MYKIAVAAIVALASQCATSAPNFYSPREGDFVFQSLPKGDLVEAIEGASQSPYSHVGMVIRKNDQWFVREAIGDVHDTPLHEWGARGRMNHAFDAFRLKTELQKFVPEFIKDSEVFLGRPYDYKYDMGDQAIYCSELLYKSMLAASGVRLGKLQKLSELKWQRYKATIEKYEGGPVPLNREMITPKALSEATQLEQVFHGYKH